MSTDFEALLKVTALLRERALDEHRKNLAERDAIASELAQIDGLRAAVQADSESLGARRMSGADTIWQGWLSSRRAEILTRSAMVKARCEDSRERAKTAFARDEAGQEIATQDRQKRILALEARRMDALEALIVLRHAGSETAQD